jgi:hypothetical protein
MRRKLLGSQDADLPTLRFQDPHLGKHELLVFFAFENVSATANAANPSSSSITHSSSGCLALIRCPTKS